jgi:hypothetical protein
MFQGAIKRALLSAGITLGATAAASAAVMGGTLSFVGGSQSFGFDGSGDFTFTDISSTSNNYFDSIGVSTTAGGGVTSFGLPTLGIPFAPTTFQNPRFGFNAPSFGPDTTFPFLSYATTTTISGSATPEIIGLRDIVGGETYYGYAVLGGPQLVSYAFESTPGLAIVPGVPLPSSAPMFGAALVALSAVGYGLKRKAKAAA